MRNFTREICRTRFKCEFLFLIVILFIQCLNKHYLEMDRKALKGRMQKKII